ncbi:MAG TPA: sigma-E factor regulatory protein RseB domain-containing protein [Bryobacteraceae bacterium]|jgi:outer membrane lipoprotein-sorting protein|nr:sigma-E factor regulatory protein RseB domain-containing protein [Bryobacteraceae bacterium]
MRLSGMVRRLAPLFAITFSGALLSAQTLNDVMARMDKTAPQFKSMMADMRRKVHTAIVNDDSMDNGTIKVKREKAGETHMLIELTGPDAKSVSFDGKEARIYYPKIKTVQVYNAADKRDLIDDFLLLGFGNTSAELKAKYDVSFKGAENIDGKPTTHIQLLPKSKEVLRRLKRADLWISDATGLPVQQQLFFAASGDYMLVTYSNVKLNPPSSELGSLDLKLPKKGVHIEHPQL